MIRYYGRHEYPELADKGHQPGRTGVHSVWVWMKSGETVSAQLGRTEATTRAGGRQPYVWMCLKRLSMRKQVDFRISLRGADIEKVGLVAVCSSPTDDPGKHHPATSTHHRSPQPSPDARAAHISDVHTPRTLTPFDALETWNDRAAEIRAHILTTFGLSAGFPTDPLKPRVFGKVERDGYTVEKVEFQSLSGFYCYGNLYRPTTKGPHPGVLCPHGHCRNGRFEDSDEAFASIPGRCINLARQGHVTFSYDMVGYNDSWQIPHRDFGGRLEDLWGIGIMGLQLINSSRALDFLLTLPDVDSDRIGCTGASGGATQTFMLTAVDDRVHVSAPVNMISAHMQGGCNCENQAGLRVDLNNIEIASAMAPRPMIMVSATGDWTVNTPDLEYPAVRDVYRLYGAENRVKTVQVDAGHNYNRESREHVYAWFGKWLLGIDDPARFREQPFKMEARPLLSVTHDRPRPGLALSPAGVQTHLKKRVLSEPRSRAQEKDTLKRVLAVDSDPNVSYQHLGQNRSATHITTRLLLERDGDRIPALRLTPAGRSRATVVLFHPDGKSALFTSSGKPNTVVTSLLSSGCSVVLPDLFLTGESARYNGPDRDHGDRHFAAYNLTDAQCRIQDMITVAAFAAGQGGRLLIGALRGTGMETLLARPFMPRIHTTLVDISGTRPESDTWWRDNLYIPGIRQIGDLSTAASAFAPARVALFGASTHFPLGTLRKPYRARKQAHRLTSSETKFTAAHILDQLK